MSDLTLKIINTSIETASDAGMSTKGITDTHHSFAQLYECRTILFAIVCNNNPDIAWKSKKHYDEENDPMFNGDFIAGINTPNGSVTFHLKLKYWDYFNVPELERALKYDGHSVEENIERLESLLSNKEKEKIYKKKMNY